MLKRTACLASLLALLAPGILAGPRTGVATGKVMTAARDALPDAQIVLEHTVFAARYAQATSGKDGTYSVQIPEHPSGSWTAKAQITRQAYGQTYTFDLEPDSTQPFRAGESPARNFVWKLSGPRGRDGQFYGAHVDLYNFGSSVPLHEVKLVLKPTEKTLIDGSPAQQVERKVVSVAGTDMAPDIPIGRYLVQAIHVPSGRLLKLDNRSISTDAPAREQPVVFGKAGHRAATEYNVEFWISD